MPSAMHIPDDPLIPSGGTDTIIMDERRAAAMLGVSPRTLQDMRLNGGGPAFVKLTGTRIGYMRADLIAWARSRVVASTSAATVARAKRAGRVA